MRLHRRARLLARVFVELMLYDVVMRVWGFSGVNRWARRRRVSSERAAKPDEAAIVRAVSAAGSFYWKPIRCLQRSVVTARVMAHYGAPADVVIGYRPAPFFSHAWVEVNGRVANDSPGFQQKLSVLERL